MTRTCFVLLAALSLVACDDTSPPTDGGGGGGTDAGTTTMDAGGGGTDAGGGGTDAGMTMGSDGGMTFASDAAVGADCLFNFECGADQACTDCTSDACLCEVGARGAGRVGDACTDNSDCLNGNCFTVNGVTACTMPCDAEGADSAECGGLLPDCEEVPFFAQVCSDFGEE